MKKLIISLSLCLGVILGGCNDSFLDKAPITGITEENLFVSYDNFKAFMWPCYEMFQSKTILTSITAVGQESFYRGDMNAGYLEQKYENGYNKYAYQTVENAVTGNGWDFSSFIRRINIMLSHLDNSKMTDSEKDHWRAVGYFFHSFWYMELIDRFGDVPWVDKVLDDSSLEMFNPRDSRDVVAANILERLQWAEQHIGDFNDGDNTINVDCIRAALSRFTLREGTWRKYHELNDAEKYLKECTRVSALLMNDYPDLFKGAGVDAGQPAAGYGQLWNSESLAGVPGVILYKEFTVNKTANSSSHYEHTASHFVEMSQRTVDLYLMKNGKPILNENSEYYGDKDMYAVFRNRDPRLYQVVMPPYKVKAGGANKPTGNPKASWGYTDDPADREYIDLLGENVTCSNPGEGMKRLPAQNWTASLVPEIPRLGTGAFVTCRSGYYVWKNYTNWEENFNAGIHMNTADKPFFKIEEVLLNYAEAMFELGQFNQGVADQTINRLRDRVGVARMNVTEIGSDFDPNRGYYYPKKNTSGIQVDPLLWEIRRERIIELMGEGFGFYDIRRWRMAPWFLNKAAIGMWTTKEYAVSKGMTLYNPQTGLSDGKEGAMAEGNLFLWNDPQKEGKGWLDKYYLYQVPTTEIVLNPNLSQNPGYN